MEMLDRCPYWARSISIRAIAAVPASGMHG
jgi:hypothetical protein